MSTVLLGNPAPMMQVKRDRVDDEGNVVTEQIGVPAEHLNQSVTRFEMWDGIDDSDFVELTLSTGNDRVLTMIARALGDDHRQYAVAVHEIDQAWSAHCGNGVPTYVSSDDAGLQAAIAAFYECPEGEPVALQTNQGRDDLHNSHLSLTQPAGHTFMAVSANSTAPSTGTVTLPGEITTAGGGLIRAAATMAHTSGTNTTTATKTFTANGTDSLPVVLAKMGMQNALTGTGKCGYETLLNATSTLTISGDNVTITWTDTVG